MNADIVPIRLLEKNTVVYVASFLTLNGETIVPYFLPRWCLGLFLN